MDKYLVSSSQEEDDWVEESELSLSRGSSKGEAERDLPLVKNELYYQRTNNIFPDSIQTVIDITSDDEKPALIDPLLITVKDETEMQQKSEKKSSRKRRKSRTKSSEPLNSNSEIAHKFIKQSTLESPELSAIMSLLSSISEELTSLKTIVTSIRTEQSNLSKFLLKDKSGIGHEYKVNPIVVWTQNFGVEFPMKNKESLIFVDQQVEYNFKLKKILCSTMSSIAHTDDTLHKNVTAVIKKLISPELALYMKLTTLAATAPNIHLTLLQFFGSSLQNTSVQIASAIEKAMTSCKTWDGNCTSCLNKTEN